MKDKHGFLFDMDGVIIDSNPTHKVALKQFCKDHGFDLTEEQLKTKIYGRTNKDWIPAVFGDIPREKIKKYADEKEALFRKLYKDTIEPLEGLRKFLDQMESAGIPRAIATSAPRENVDFTLLETGIEQYFDTILDESHVEKGKPDPEIYLKSAAAIGFPPDRCVVFEDSLSGVKAGKAAGCKVVALTTTHTPEELAEADLIIKNFEEITPEQVISRLFY